MGVLAAAVLSCALAVPGAWAAGPVSGIVVFGDSLSDSGNAFALQRENNTPPNYSVDALLVPDDAYARGGHHFTNGPTWVEDFAKSVGLGPDAGPAFRDHNSRATNYAVGGARANDDGKNVDLAEQVDAFLHDFGGSAPPGALYVIAIGGNDIRDALAAFGAGQDPAPVIAAGVSAIGTNINTLYGAGARRFLVWNVPNASLVPAVSALGPGAVAVAKSLAQTFNFYLGGQLASLEALPGISITQFDAYAAVTTIYSNPSVFGLTDVTDPCISPNDPPFVCKNPDTFLFWGGLHPTSAVHAIVAQAVQQLLGM